MMNFAIQNPDQYTTCAMCTAEFEIRCDHEAHIMRDGKRVYTLQSQIINGRKVTVCDQCLEPVNSDEPEPMFIKYMGCLCSKECVRWFKLMGTIQVFMQQMLSPRVPGPNVDLSKLRG